MFGSTKLLYVHKLVTNFLQLFHWKQLPAGAENDTRAVRVNQNNKIAGQKNKTICIQLL